MQSINPIDQSLEICQIQEASVQSYLIKIINIQPLMIPLNKKRPPMIQ